MFLAMDAREPDMCRVAGRLCRALTDGDARSLAVLTRSFPPGLLVPSPPDQAKRCRVFLSFFSLYLTWRTGATYSGTKPFGICVGLFLVLNGLNKEKSFSFLLNWIERSLCFVFCVFFLRRSLLFVVGCCRKQQPRYNGVSVCCCSFRRRGCSI